MICELAYASAAEMTQFVTDLKALQDRWPNDFARVLDDFDAIAYDIFVTKGVPFTEVVQYLQEFGSASETADVAHRLLIPNVKNDTPEEKSVERVLRRDAMRRLVQFFNSLMTLLVNSAYHPAKKESFEPLLVSSDVAARLFSMTTEEFNSVAENCHIPAIRLGKDNATGHEIVRYHMETLKAFLSVSAKASFLDRNSYIYQRNAMPKFPDEDEFRRRQEATVRRNREKKEELRQKGQQEQKAQHGGQQQRANSQNRQKQQTGSPQRNQQAGGQHRDQQKNSDQKIPPTWRKNPVDVMADAKKKQEEAAKKASSEKAVESAEKKPDGVKASQKPEKAPEAVEKTPATTEKAPAKEAEAAKKPENAEVDAPSKPATDAETEQPPVVFSAHKPSAEDTQKNADFGNTVAKKKASPVDDFAADLLKEMDGSSTGDDEEVAKSTEEEVVSQEGKNEESSSDSPSGRMPSPDPKNDDSEDGLDNGLAFSMKSLGTGL